MATKQPQGKTAAEQTPQEPVVTMLIPAEGNGSHVEGCINGTNFRIKTGVPVTVPLRIAAVITDSQRQLYQGEQLVAAFEAYGGKRIG